MSAIAAAARPRARSASIPPDKVGMLPSGGTPPPPMIVGVALAATVAVLVGDAVAVSVGPPGVIV